jgi:hypothetical protein
MYDLLQEAAITAPVEGNQGGSYLTMKSNQGLVFGAATLLTGSSGVFCDQGGYYRSRQAKPCLHFENRLLAKGECYDERCNRVLS